MQVVTGNQQHTSVNTKDGQKGGTSATAPHAQAAATTEKESWLRAVLPYAAGVVALGLLYSLIPLGLSGSGWLLALLRRG
ncbi:hypothetical protein DNI29_16975 [Hymenobacter sediminis]|uniref:hypothetical protein n=1 Tax=Hymenobacter sediminis TaxID=2218621 RepID=UPI000DA6567C|nr:hypothetical protein [Hymenobacter sediminis]RPD45842.1 hypothetical protein DNI29_16975 [Hymenobacter sediminis]